MGECGWVCVEKDMLHCHSLPVNVSKVRVMLLTVVHIYIAVKILSFYGSFCVLGLPPISVLAYILHGAEKYYTPPKSAKFDTSEAFQFFSSTSMEW